MSDGSALQSPPYSHASQNAKCIFDAHSANPSFSLYLQQSRFNKLSDTIVNRIDEMGSKIDEVCNVSQLLICFFWCPVRVFQACSLTILDSVGELNKCTG